MSILIRGMEMPSNCYDCPFLELQQDEKAYCLAGLFEMFGIYTQQRYYICPLVEIPTPHGRLIDADILTKRFEELTTIALEYTAKLNKQEGNHELWRRWSTIWAERSAYMHDLYDAPTVIESEE